MVMQTEMLIGSKFEKGTETEEQILNPKTGEAILGLPEASQFGTGLAMTSGAALIGSLCLLLAFWRRRPAQPDSKANFLDAARAAALAAAEAQAKRGAAAQRAMPAGAAAPRSSSYPTPRSGFGRHS
jgi:hypothetical protein